MPIYFDEQLQSDTLRIATMQDIALYQLPTIAAIEQTLSLPEIRVTAELLQKGDEEPVLVMTYHAKSSSKDVSVRQAELQRINNYMIELQKFIFQRIRFVIKNVIVMGDLNENLLVLNNNSEVCPAFDKIREVIGGLGADFEFDGDTKITDLGLADNIQTKLRGSLGDYNGYINPQATEDGEIVDDSKNAVFALELANHCVWEENHLSFTNFPSTVLPFLSRKKLASCWTSGEIVARQLNFNEEDTGYKDHADARLTAFGFNLVAKSFLPLNGTKGLHNPEEVFTREVLADTACMSVLQAQSTQALFSALHRHAGSSFPLTMESRELRYTLQQLNKDFQTDEAATLEAGVERIRLVVNEWMGSSDYQQVLAFLLPRIRQEVTDAMSEMLRVGGKINETVINAKKNGLDKTNIVEQIVKLLFQTQQQDLLGGYAKINGHSVVYKQNVINQYAKDLQTSIQNDEATVIVVTGATAASSNQSVETVTVLKNAVHGHEACDLTHLWPLSCYASEMSQELGDFFLKLQAMDKLCAQQRAELYHIRSFFNDIDSYESKLGALIIAYPEHEGRIGVFSEAIKTAVRSLNDSLITVDSLLEFKRNFNTAFSALRDHFDAYESKTWQDLDLLVKNILGVVAVLAVAPAVYVAVKEQKSGGFYGTFFKDSVTKALGETPLPTASLGL
jgi:hypothetical protein